MATSKSQYLEIIFDTPNTSTMGEIIDLFDLEDVDIPDGVEVYGKAYYSSYINRAKDELKKALDVFDRVAKNNCTVGFDGEMQCKCGTYKINEKHIRDGIMNIQNAMAALQQVYPGRVNNNHIRTIKNKYQTVFDIMRRSEKC